MLYEVRLSDAETGTLRGLIGHCLDAVECDGWAAYLRLPGRNVRVQPEEVPTPGPNNPTADVERPMVMSESPPTDEGEAVVVACGRIVSVDVLSVLLTFTPPAPAAPLVLPGIGELPPGVEYWRLCHQPGEKERLLTAVGKTQAVVDLDIAIDVRTERVPHVVLYTHSYWVRACAGLPDSEDWVQDRAFSRRCVTADDNHRGSGDSQLRSGPSE